MSNSARSTGLPPCQVDPKAIISEKATIIGSYPVTIGAHSVLHPYAKIDSTHGPVTIGQYCIIDERAAIGLAQPATVPALVRLDDYVTVDTGAIVQAAYIGKFGNVGACACLHPDVQIGQFCKVPPACTVSRGEHLVDFAFFSKDGKHRIDHTTASRPGVQQLKLQGQAMHIDTLRKLIPTNIARWQT